VTKRTITAVEALPLRAELPHTLRTASDAKDSVAMVLVRVHTDDGLVGYGECMGRWAPLAYARIIDDLFTPRLLGRDPFDAAAIWRDLSRSLYARTGGMLVEAIAGVDIALWDLMGKAAGLPVFKLLGGIGRSEVAAYASSIMVTDDETTLRDAERLASGGFSGLKLKVAGDPVRDLERVDAVRLTIGDDVKLFVDANWAYDLPTAARVGDALADRGVQWLEEPLVPEDHAGYQALAARTRIAIACGESEFTAAGLADLITSRSIGFVQPDVARAGGITETRRIATLADTCNVAFAPHVGFSGAVCVAATLHLCAAAPNFSVFEAMVIPNPLREELCVETPGDPRKLTPTGCLSVPEGPGLGIEIREDALERFLVTA
jgi:D-galactarolactone cycloisomerase